MLVYLPSSSKQEKDLALVPRAQKGTAGDHTTAVRLGSGHQDAVSVWTSAVRAHVLFSLCAENHLQQQEIEYPSETLTHTSVSGVVRNRVCGDVLKLLV